ncbi:olfactory receptor 10A6-like [Plectropomus leopardus]|uniref:olfactory receptor 10A6-like n=1 Tax=Plectropomus leopardus TaxID=160734 RepID=UPI001C4D731B|nr:olfactory receptor 10A6-like [Plectropomus leopardus]
MNSTQVSYFALVAYFDAKLFKYVFFIIVLILYIAVICANVCVIVVICVNRSLHEPMYLFLVSLCVNELYGSSGLFPFLLLQILSDLHTVSAAACFLQIFCIYSYGSIELLNLAVMSYDRYLAVCFPLQYNARMTNNKVIILVALIWFLIFLVNFLTLSLIVPLQLCGNVINKVYCDNHSVVKLACSDTSVYNVYGLSVTSLSVFCPVILIFSSYIKILRVCFSGSRQTRQKAVSTCTPHLASLLNFSFAAFFEILQSRFDMSAVPNVLRIFLSLYFLTCPPLFNPLMYGLKLPKIRVVCKHLISNFFEIKLSLM